MYKTIVEKTSEISSEIFFHSEAYNNKNNLLHLYSAFLGTQSALHSKGGISSNTTSVQHPPGWCDGSHIVPECSPHTSLLVERRQSDETNQQIVRRPWWSKANWWIWPGYWGHTSTLLERHRWIFNNQSQDLGLTSHPKDGAFYSIESPSLYWGVMTHTDHRVSTPCWPH